MIKIKILTGSTRPGRFNIQVASWIYDIAKQRSDIDVELVDIAALDLPLLDEPITPMQRQYSQKHTIEWSSIVDEADGFIMVTPEYNHSTSAALKNAIDYLFHEWHFKPVSFISYGSLAGGSRAVEHLRGISAELKMYDLREQIMLPNYWEHLDENGQYLFYERHEKSANEIIDNLSFWANKMKDARKELISK